MLNFRGILGSALSFEGPFDGDIAGLRSNYLNNKNLRPLLIKVLNSYYDNLSNRSIIFIAKKGGLKK
jgi:hypothetical protein